MPDKTSLPPDDPNRSPDELQDALESAHLSEEERKSVENALQRETPPDPDEVLAGDPEDAVLGAVGHDEALDPEESDPGLDEVLADAPSDRAHDEPVAEVVEPPTDSEGDLSQDFLDELIADAGDAGEQAEPESVNTSSTDAELEAEEPGVPQDVLDSLLAEAEGAPPVKPVQQEAKPVSQSSLVHQDGPRSLPPAAASLRLIASIVVGVFGAVVVFYALSTNRLRPLMPEDLAPTLQLSALEAAVQAAESLIAEGRHQDAANELEAALASAPPSALKVDAQYLYLEALAGSLPDTLEPQTAARYHSEVDRLIELAPLHPNAPAALLFNARVYEAEDNNLAARALYRDILDDYPDAANADRVLLAAGQLELELDRPVEAADYFQRLISNYPASPLVERARLHMGDALQLAGNYDGARVTFVRLAQAHPGTRLGDEAFERLGRLAYETGDYESAVRELESRLTMSTSIEGNDRVYLLLAKTYSASGEPEKALQLLRELLDFFPETEVTPFAHIELSKVQSLMGMDRDATRTATQAVDRYPDHPAVLRNAGELLARVDRHDAAAEAFERAYHAGDRDPALLLSAGETYGAAELYTDAKRVLDVILIQHATAPEALDAVLVWAELQFDQGNVTDAFSRLESLAEVTRERAQQFRIKSVLASLYERIGFVEEAARIYAEIPELTAEPAMLARSAQALFATGAIDEGLEISERVEVARLADAEAYDFLLAKGRALLGADTRYALDTLETAHELYPLQRTPEGGSLLLRANLAAGRNARARAVMVDMRTQFENDPDAAPWLAQAANYWGDFLYGRRDYRAAADAYAYTAEASEAPGNAETWALYQRANALYKLANFEESLRLYQRVAQSQSPWSAEAASKVESVKIDMKLRGLSIPELQEAG